jgi:hypothetical protein
MKINFKFWSVLLVFALYLTSLTLVLVNAQVLQNSSNQGNECVEVTNPYADMPTGSITMTPEELEEFKKIAFEIKGVLLNSYALTRNDVEGIDFSDAQPVKIGDEIIAFREYDSTYFSSSASSSSLQSTTTVTLPSFVDNSTSKFFPPIGT